MPIKDSLAWEITRDFTKFAVPPIILMLFGVWVYYAFFAPKPYGGVKLQENVIYASARRFKENGIEALKQDGQDVKFEDWRSLAASGQIGPDVTIFVHGYNAQEHKVAAYFSDLIGHLQKTARYQGTIIVFDWPAQGVPHDELPTVLRLQRDISMDALNSNSQPAYELSMYKMDQRNAETIGPEAFLALLGSLAGDPPRRITLIGHSMGCHLLQHALMQNSWAFQRVREMFWLAPDVDVDVLADDSFVGAVDGLQEGLTIHYSAHDNILTGLSTLANGKHRIGAVGLGSHTVATPKIRFADMTSALGSENVHGGYLLAGSASARQIAADLTQP